MEPAISGGDGKKREKKREKKHKLKDVKALGHQLLSSRAHINNLPLLLTFVAPSSPPSHVVESVLSLQSFFTPLVPDLPSLASASSSHKWESEKDPELIYKTWLRSKFDEFVRSLVGIVVSPDASDTLKEIVLDTLMEFVKLGKGGSFQSTIYHRLIHSIVNSPVVIDPILEDLSLKYFKYIDVSYFTYISLEKIMRTIQPKEFHSKNVEGGDAGRARPSLKQTIHKIHRIIFRIPPPGGRDDPSNIEMWSGSELDVNLSKDDGEQLKSDKGDKVLSAASVSKKIKLKFTKAWLSFLRLPLPLDVYKEVLVYLHKDVIPHLSNSSMLCDFLTRSYDIGGVVSVMALSSLYILMTQHGLEYPNFYDKLYALLQPSIFMAKHRAKFFELLDSCLRSPLLPAYLAAAFAKKLSRMTLSVPPSGSLVIIALIHNLLRRHPSINCLVHREDDGAATKGQAKMENDVIPGFDHFRDEEVNPIKTNALRTSLWEVDSLRYHYCPAVSRFVLSLESDLTVRAKTTEVNVKDMSSGSYGTIFGDEMRRRVKQVPLAFYRATPSSLFSESDFPGWSFQLEAGAEEDEDNHGDCRTCANASTGQYAKRQRLESTS
ncbi:hypothetical protein SAY87_014303 [Trapa incisa]|uniref:CCAAT-binding factor domain-containing protein n=1 Tax=Trapa incisa TaxID=236973 RepID=A0AAN7H2P2_9MYRT|nr:hypothetical protein SAY87_014303 [Trapa incisa]